MQNLDDLMDRLVAEYADRLAGGNAAEKFFGEAFAIFPFEDGCVQQPGKCDCDDRKIDDVQYPRHRDSFPGRSSPRFTVLGAAVVPARLSGQRRQLAG